MVFIKDIQIKPVSFSLKRPFITAKGRKTETHNVAIFLLLSSGKKGYGEASTSIAFADQTAPMIAASLTRLMKRFLHRPIEAYGALIKEGWKIEGDHPAAAAAMECALLDAYCRHEGISLAQFLGRGKRTIETDLTFSIRSPKELHQEAIEAQRKGFRKFKVKLNGEVGIDIDRLKAVHQAAPRAKLVADGNQGFTLAGAVALAHAVHAFKIPVVFFEQPFARGQLSAMRHYRKKARLPLIADESIFNVRDAERLFDSGAADGINVKIAKSGVLESRALALLAKRRKKILSIGCMEESRWGLAPSVHLATSVGPFDWIDLDSAFLLKPTGQTGGFTMNGPRLSVQGIRAGIGAS